MAADQTRPAFALYRLIWTALDWVYPPVCAICGTPGARICQPCLQSLPRISEPICPVCGDAVQTASLCPDCSAAAPPMQQLRSIFSYQTAVKRLVHRLKFHRDLALGDIMAQPMIETYSDLQWTVDLVAVVPLSRKRMNERGYNQAALLAKPLALFFGLPYTSRAVKRIIETPSQVGLNARERKQNVENAFLAEARIVNQKSILLVDDVLTTGATMFSCANALLAAGAERVYGLSFARTVLTEDNNLDTDHIP